MATKVTPTVFLRFIAAAVAWIGLGSLAVWLLGQWGINDLVFALLAFLLASFIMVPIVPNAYRKRTLQVTGLATWTVGGFFAAQFLVVLGARLLVTLGVDLESVNESLLSAVLAAVSYTVALAIVIGVPFVAKRSKVTRKDIGLHRLPTWSELGIAPLGYVASMIVTGFVTYLLIQFVPQFNINEAQDVGFTYLATRSEYILAFVTLVIVAPVAEEILFRGYLYGKLKKYTPVWVAILITSALFGFAHGQWNVAVATFVLGVFLCLLRDITGSLWPSIVLHMIKNGIAYYILFVNPMFLGTLGG